MELMPMQADRTVSRFALSDLALQSAIELEKLKAGHGFDERAMAELAEALIRTSNPGEGVSRSRFFEVGYSRPFMRLFRDRQASDPQSIKEVQEYVEEVADQIRAFLKQQNAKDASNLAGFCIDLHRELVRGLVSESRLGRRRSRTRRSNASTSFG